MNHGLSQRENVPRNPLAKNQGENAKPLALSSATNKPLGLSAKPTNVSSKTKALGDHHAKPRPILSDKSNKGVLQSKLQSTKSVKETITTSSSTLTTKVIVDEKITTTATAKKQDTLDQTIATKEDFFQDNESRYGQEQEETISIVPVLPIKVPEKMKHLFIKDTFHSTAQRPGSNLNSNKRTFDTLENSPYSSFSSSSSSPYSAAKKLKPSTSHPKDLFVENAPPLGLELTQETIKYEHEQEMRAKLAMLQTTQSLREDQWNDPMLVAEYAGEIFGYLFDSEPGIMADPMYANNQQHEISWKMRSVLVDWVIEIHYLFGLLPETLFLAVNIIDRFLSLRTVALGKLQLVGITSLYIATKFEENMCPIMQDFLYMTDKGVSEDEFIKAERFIMQILDFRFCYPNPLNFLRRICTEEMNCDVHTRTLAKYFMEISCIDHRFIGVRPSKVAAAALWLSKKMLVKGKWNSHLTKLSGYAPQDFRSTVEAMLDYLSQTVTHDAFFKKWSTKRFSKASIFVRDWINRYYIN
ncbi:G2/mitotic-specific cyclin 1/2 [Mucor circinelloides 1006PhL]|uniref:G2/mitotic-specific cyclin 1/2 n=1 Tax=Mucor circinelloides f. circinelloides (strain 1006PhL) TaxID=1220926 RepID=S2JZP6_MUCC1|nr:G2/mitotic-specific cyclin 1/2 [Mucor circinelloides 1006PhL]